MSNILIIKHGSLGDIIQANGAMKDIKNFYKTSKVLLITSEPYSSLMSQCPYIDGVIIDKRLPRWNIFYLLRLKKLLKRYNFEFVFDLQNSSRTSFYRKFILRDVDWSSSETSLEPGQIKKDFDAYPVLERMKIQLEKSAIITSNIKNIDLTWAYTDIERLIKQYTNDEFILIFPFCSKKHKQKKWPYFKELVNRIKEVYKNKYSILVAPGPGEIEEARSLNAKVVLENNKPISLTKLISLINKSKLVISNDTGPAHIASHLKKSGIVLFGSHISADKVSLGNEYFKIISEKKLSEIKTVKVLQNIREILN